MPHIIQRGRRCVIIVLNVHARTEDKCVDKKHNFSEEPDQFLTYHTKILLDFNAKVRSKDILKATIWNDSLHEISSDNWATVVNFASSKNLIIKRTISHITKFVIILEVLLFERHTIRLITS
jgi:hypothetical protein